MAGPGATEEAQDSNINLLVANHKIPEAVDMSLGENVLIERIDVAKVNQYQKAGVQAFSGGDPKYEAEL